MKYFLAFILFTVLSCTTVPSYVPTEEEVSSVLRLEGLYNGSTGTGFIVQGASGQKYIATNSHVCTMDTVITASAGRKWYQTAVMLSAPEWDLCVLLVGGNDLKPLPIGFAHSGVLTSIGFPNGEGPKVSKAFLEAFMLNRNGSCLDVNACGFFTGVSIPGASGSPMLDLDGKVSCILFAGASDGNSGLCAPANPLKSLLDVI